MEQFYQLLIYGKVQRENGPCIDVTDFTFTENEGAKVPYAYAADCLLKPAVTTCSSVGTNLKFEKSAKTFIGYFGHRGRKNILRFHLHTQLQLIVRDLQQPQHVIW